MSPVSMGGNWQDEPPLARKLAHSYLAAGLALAASGVATAGPWWDTIAEQSLWVTLLWAVPWAAILTWFIFATVAWMKHPMAACVRCLTDIPTDGAVRAKRLWRRLRMHHLRTVRSYLLWNTGVLVAAIALGVPDWGPLPWISAAALIGWWVVQAFSYVSERTHLRLAPWCPYCKGGGDDDPTPSEPVVPDPSGTKVAS